MRAQISTMPFIFGTFLLMYQGRRVAKYFLGAEHGETTGLFFASSRPLRCNTEMNYSVGAGDTHYSLDAISRDTPRARLPWISAQRNVLFPAAVNPIEANGMLGPQCPN